MRSRNVLLALAAGGVSGALLFLGTGLHPLWWSLWLAPVPILALSPRLRARTTFLLASVAYLIGEMNQWNYLTGGIQLPLALIVILLAIPALVFGLVVLFTRGFLRRGSLFHAALAFPASWVAYEYLTEIGSPHSTFGNLGYTQMNCLPVIQLASITGIWGISFVVFLFAGAVGALLSAAGNPAQRRALAITVGVIVCATFLFGQGRLRSNPSAQSIAVTLMAKDVPMSAYLGPEKQALELLHEYADEIRRTVTAGTDVVVLPEKIGRVSENALPEVDALFSATATATDSTIVLGLVRKTSAAAFNSSRFYSRAGKLEGNYDKQHLLPGVEPEKPGDQRVILDQPSGRWGLQICKDMDFPQLSREYANDSVNLLLVPAWDFDLDRWLHARMAVLRAVENGFALARAGRNGLLTLSDNRGRIVAETATVPDGFVSISGKVNVVRETTFYTRTGDWFAWLCVATFFLLLGARFLPTRTRASS
ncbi:MAG: nitrilase-related carbon-nitrogen hydrolase [Spartobacteria bacterium]